MKREVEENIKVLKGLTENLSLRELFSSDSERTKRYSIRSKELDLFYDFSKNLVDQKSMDTLSRIAEHADIRGYAEKMFSGEKINFTEKRAVLHTALRDFSGKSVLIDGKDVSPDIIRAREKIKDFSDRVRSGSFRGSTGKRIKSVINIGIGGSDLGPRMAALALSAFSDGPRILFVSNIDAADIQKALKDTDPEETLFLVASKTFTTQETITNALTAREWLVDALGDDAVKHHFAALSTNIREVEKFGIDPDNMFGFWDFVGGRYSLWSSIGLSVAISAGYDNFERMLRGADAADKHFFNSDYSENIPVIMGLLGLLYNNVFDWGTYAILPYSQYLERFPAYLQQCDMESNGKSVSFSGERIDYATGPVIWGEPGTNSQHSFFQLIHQGRRVIPADFIGFINQPDIKREHHDKLIANMFAQSQALAFGLSEREAETELRSSGMSEDDIRILLPHKTFPGNRPSSTFLFRDFTPHALGVLTALYEHKIFAQGVLWEVNSFDQWGVELGKKLAGGILKKMRDKSVSDLDASTAELLKEYMDNKRG